MNADDKARWLKPSPPIAVDGGPASADDSAPDPRRAPPEPLEIPASDQRAQLISRPTRIDAIRIYPRHDYA